MTSSTTYDLATDATPTSLTSPSSSSSSCRDSRSTTHVITNTRSLITRRWLRSPQSTSLTSRSRRGDLAGMVLASRRHRWHPPSTTVVAILLSSSDLCRHLRSISCRCHVTTLLRHHRVTTPPLPSPEILASVFSLSPACRCRHHLVVAALSSPPLSSPQSSSDIVDVTAVCLCHRCHRRPRHYPSQTRVSRGKRKGQVGCGFKLSNPIYSNPIGQSEFDPQLKLAGHNWVGFNQLTRTALP